MNLSTLKEEFHSFQNKDWMLLMITVSLFLTQYVTAGVLILYLGWMIYNKQLWSCRGQARMHAVSNRRTRHCRLPPSSPTLPYTALPPFSHPKRNPLSSCPDKQASPLRQETKPQIYTLKLSAFFHRYFIPVCPKPPVLRPLSERLPDNSHSTVECRATTIWHIRSPWLTTNGSEDRLTNITHISPR